MSIVETLQQARRARLQRIAARAVTALPPARSPAQGRTPSAFACHEPGDPDYERAWAFAMLGVVPPAARQRLKPTVADIQRATERHYGLEPGDLSTHSAVRGIVRARQIAMYLTRELTAQSYPEIGRCFGGRIHVTALRAVRMIERQLACDEELAADVDDLRAALASRESWL
jgi:hypothetical protein